MRTSVIVLTYERPDALALCLAGLARQSVLPDEVIVTDDGSGPATRACVARAARRFPCRLAFTAHDREGPRMARARNRGAAASRGDYLVFLDGDQVPTRHFVADHRAFARPGTWIQASRILLPEQLSVAMLAEGRLDVPLLAPGLERRRHALRAPWLWKLVNRRHRSQRGVKSCNFAFWRDDLLALNGFNEAMTGWGLEDGELAARAYNRGLWRRDLRLGGAVAHLWHPPTSLADENPNWSIYRETVARRLIRCDRGLDAHLEELRDPLPDLRGATAR